MKQKKYILYSGYLHSINDGDRHFISYSQLIRLYKLDISECIDGSKLLDDDPRMGDHNYFHLNPILQGNYEEYLNSLIK